MRCCNFFDRLTVDVRREFQQLQTLETGQTLQPSAVGRGIVNRELLQTG